MSKKLFHTLKKKKIHTTRGGLHWSDWEEKLLQYKRERKNGIFLETDLPVFACCVGSLWVGGQRNLSTTWDLSGSLHSCAQHQSGCAEALNLSKLFCPSSARLNPMINLVKITSRCTGAEVRAAHDQCAPRGERRKRLFKEDPSRRKRNCTASAVNANFLYLCLPPLKESVQSV